MWFSRQYSNLVKTTLFQHYSMLNSVVFKSISKSCENHTVGYLIMLNSVVFTRLDIDVSPPTNCRVIKPYTSWEEGYSYPVKTTFFQHYSMLNSVVFTSILKTTLFQHYSMLNSMVSRPLKSCENHTAKTIL